MSSTSFFASCTVLTAILGIALVAGCTAPGSEAAAVRTQTQHDVLPHHAGTVGFDHRMRVIPNPTPANAPAHGWRYFTDPSSPRAVVISPRGDYYFSRGQGLEWIAAELAD